MDLLNPVEARVLGCLIEKELTTPDYYPLTLNALTLACNQKSNRDPVVAFDDATVQKAIDALKIRTIVMGVHPAGSRVVKYKHVLREKHDFIADEIAIICELLIRGPQTVGELRTHCERMHAFAGVDDVRDVLVRLSRRAEPVTRELPRLPGQKEPRWTHLLCGEPDLNALAEGAAAEPIRVNAEADSARIATLEGRIEEMETQLGHLRREFAAFREQFEN